MAQNISRRGFICGGAAAVAALGVAGLAGCSGSSSASSEKEVERVTIRVAGLKGPTSMGMVKMLEDSKAGKTKNTYEYTMGASADELVPAFNQGELDILAVPANLGAILYNSTNGGAEMLCANMLGAIYVLEVGDTISTIEDLKGKTIYTVGKGSTPEFLLRYLLNKHGLNMDTDVTVEFKEDATEVVGLLAAGTATVAMLPQPVVTVALAKVPGVNVVLDMNAEWDAVANGPKLVTAGLIGRKEFIDAHPEQIKDFLDELKTSTDWTNANVEEAAELIGSYDIVDASIAKVCLPACNVVCITGKEMKDSTEAYFQVLFDQNPESVGGKMPGNDFYYGA